MHNKLEKNRRAHLRECFEFLRKQLPASDDKKLSNLGILRMRCATYRYINKSILGFGECVESWKTGPTKPYLRDLVLY